MNNNSLPLPIVVLLGMILITTNITAQYIVECYGIQTTLAIFIYPLSFLITDYVSEIYGKSACYKLVRLGFIFCLLPSIIFSTLQITLGSLVAYLIAQFHDVWAFGFWKEVSHGKHLWFRNNLSTIISQLIDTIVFVSIAFYGVLNIDTMLSIMIAEYLIKVIIAAVDTAPLYILVNLSNRK